MALPYEVVYAGKDEAVWLSHRLTGIGASDAPAVLGISPWATPLDVYCTKHGLMVTEQTDAMAWGKVMEASLRAWLPQDRDFLEEYGEGWICQEDQRLLRSKEYPWLLCTLDAWAIEREIVKVDATGYRHKHHRKILVELKNTSAYEAWEDGCPEYVRAQVQQQMCVTGEKQAIVVACVGGAPPNWYPIERDERFIQEELLPKTEDFWEALQAQEPPEATEEDLSALNALYSNDNGDELVFPHYVQDWDDRLEEIHWLVKDAAKEEDSLKAKIKGELKECSVGILPSGKKWTWKANKKGSRVLRGPRRKR